MTSSTGSIFSKGAENHAHPSGYLQIARGLLTRSAQARLALSGPALAGSIQAFPKALYWLATCQDSIAA